MIIENEILLNDVNLILPELPAKSVDLIIADLPYGITNCHWDKTVNLTLLWQELNRVTKHNAPMIFFATQKFAVELINSNPKNFRYDLIWEKNMPTGFLDANRKPLRSHENILVFYRALPTYNPQKYLHTNNRFSIGQKNNTDQIENLYQGYAKHGKSKGYVETGERFPRSIMKFQNWNGGLALKRKSGENPPHSTQKPVDLIEYLIETFSNEGDLILDPTSGSGTTAIAAMNTNRRFICVEKDLVIWTQAQRRIEAHRAKLSQMLFHQTAR